MTETPSETGGYRFGPLFGFLVACGLMVVLIYSLQVTGMDRALTNCRERNAQFEEVNKRVPITNLLIHLEKKDPATSPLEKHALLNSHATVVPLSDCEADFAKPWPLGTGGLP